MLPCTMNLCEAQEMLTLWCSWIVAVEPDVELFYKDLLIELIMMNLQARLRLFFRVTIVLKFYPLIEKTLDTLP